MISLSKNFLIHCDIAEQYETQLNHTEIISAATVALYAEGLENQSIELSVAVSDDAEVRELNNSYRNVDNTTDVLSFAAEESQEDSNFALPLKLRKHVIWETLSSRIRKQSDKRLILGTALLAKCRSWLFMAYSTC